MVERNPVDRSHEGGDPACWLHLFEDLDGDDGHEEADPPSHGAVMRHVTATTDDEAVADEGAPGAQ